MYVQVKHTLANLALEMIHQDPRRRPLAWLLACVRMAQDRAAASFEDVRRAATTLGTAGPRSLQRLETLGIIERTDGLVGLAPPYRRHSDYASRQAERLSAALAALGEGWRDQGDDAVLRRALILFNNGLFFECHEYLEDVWRAAQESERNFYHGIIQAAAAFYHFEKGNLHGARMLLRKGLARLEPYGRRHKGVDLQRWRAALEPWTGRFEADAPARPLQQKEIPRIP